MIRFVIVSQSNGATLVTGIFAARNAAEKYLAEQMTDDAADSAICPLNIVEAWGALSGNVRIES